MYMGTSRGYNYKYSTDGFTFTTQNSGQIPGHVYHFIHRNPTTILIISILIIEQRGHSILHMSMLAPCMCMQVLRLL